jgi:hypothetical protein
VKSRANTREVKALGAGSASTDGQTVRSQRFRATATPLGWRIPMCGSAAPFVRRVLPVVGRDYELPDRPVDPTNFAGDAARVVVDLLGIIGRAAATVSPRTAAGFEARHSDRWRHIG